MPSKRNFKLLLLLPDDPILLSNHIEEGLVWRRSEWWPCTSQGNNKFRRSRDRLQLQRWLWRRVNNSNGWLHLREERRFRLRLQLQHH